MTLTSIQLQVYTLEIRHEKKKNPSLQGAAHDNKTVWRRAHISHWDEWVYGQRWAGWFCWPNTALSALSVAAVLDLPTAYDRLMNYHGMLACRAQEEGKGLAWDVCTSGRKRVEWLDSACYTSWGAHSQRRLQTTRIENPIQLHRQVASYGGEEPEVFSLIVCQWQINHCC